MGKIKTTEISARVYNQIIQMIKEKKDKPLSYTEMGKKLNKSNQNVIYYIKKMEKDKIIKVEHCKDAVGRPSFNKYKIINPNYQ